MKTALLKYKNGKKELTKIKTVDKTIEKHNMNPPKYITCSMFDNNYFETKSFNFELAEYDKKHDLYIYEEVD